MCVTDFKYVIIGDDNDKMIVCREKDFDRAKIQRAAIRAFPEIFRGLMDRLGLSGKPAIRVETCRKMFSSQFDRQIAHIETGNDWDAHPFISLWIFDKDGSRFCGAKSVPIVS